MRTKRFVCTAVIITVFAVMFITACSNPFLNEYGSAPNRPAGVTKKASTSSSITISWPSVSGATGYYIYRSTSSTGTFTQIGTSTTASYTNTGLSAGTTYYYKVAAYNSKGTGTQSAAFSATTASGNSNGWVASNGPWPTGWIPSAPNSTFWYINSISSGHFLQVSNYDGWIYLDGAGSGTHYKITSMTTDKQGIRVKKVNTNFEVIGDEITLCTGWTVSNNQLTLTGATGVFSVFNGIRLHQ